MRLGRRLVSVVLFLAITAGLAAILLVDAARRPGLWAILIIWVVAGGLGLLVGGGRTGRPGLLFQNPPDGTESVPPELPGRICDRCGKMTSLDQSTCQHCGVSLTE